MNTEENLDPADDQPLELIDWYSVGERCVLQFGETRVVVRLVGRKWRRARIAVSAHPTATARTVTEDHKKHGI